MVASFNEEDFSLVILSKVHPERELPTDVFLKIDGKMVKFKGKGDSISGEKYDLFVSKGVKNIYIPADDVMLFLEWINDSRDEAVDKMTEEAGEENRGFFERAEDFREKVYEVFFEDELNEQVVEKLRENVEEFVADIKENPITEKAIGALASRNATVADHSVNVANIAVYLAMALGHSHQFVLENVYMGAIFHDFGKAKIPDHILENRGNSMYSQAIQDHPEKGVKYIQKTKGIPAQVLTIIMQHHEQFNGHGFPRGLAGDDIYDLAQIVSMANVFDNILQENKQLAKLEKFKKAVKIIEYGKGKEWNPKFYPRALEAMQMAFSHVMKDDQ